MPRYTQLSVTHTVKIYQRTFIIRANEIRGWSTRYAKICLLLVRLVQTDYRGVD